MIKNFSFEFPINSKVENKCNNTSTWKNTVVVTISTMATKN